MIPADAIQACRVKLSDNIDLGRHHAAGPGLPAPGAPLRAVRAGAGSSGTAAAAARGAHSIDSCIARDAWTHGAALSRWEHEYEQVRPGRFSGRVQAAWLGPVQLVHECIDHAFRYRGTSWPGSRVFFSYLPGCADVFYDNRPVGTSALVTHRWNGVERINGSDRIRLVVVAVDEGWLAGQLAGLPGLEQVVRSPYPVCFAPAGASVAGFQGAVQRILADLAADPALLADERACDRMRAQVLDSILAVVAAERGAVGRLPAPSTRAYIVGRALDYMEAHLADVVSVRDICAAVRVCPRTLSYAFAEVLGVSPKSYLLATRLNRVFRELADARAPASIESIATRWGFTHMGRFAQYYRTAFGERPSDTFRVRAARSAVPACGAYPL